MCTFFYRKGFDTNCGLIALLTACACAAFQPIDANGPTSNAPQYPVALVRRWHSGSKKLQWPGTSCLNATDYPARLKRTFIPTLQRSRACPRICRRRYHLPKVGSQTNPTEEETRESLRRFIVEWQRLIGAEPNELSLVERIDDPSGVKVARYEQRPFRYPLRGGYGTLVIRFRADGQLIGFSSNCIPNADRIQATLSGLTPKLTGEQAVDHIKTQPITVTNTNGGQQTVSLPANATVTAQQLVVYAQPSKDPPSGLQIRLAWEIDVTNGPIKQVYLDAISDEIIATS